MTGVPVEIPQHIIEEAAKALVAQAALTQPWELMPEYLQDGYRRAATAVLAAVWPLIETHVREQVAGEIKALWINGSEYWERGVLGFGFMLGECAAVARGAARDPEKREARAALHSGELPGSLPAAPALGDVSQTRQGRYDQSGAARDGDTRG